ncbi:ABC transporter ATP-binding protein [Bosea minatitlanensis]
MEAAMLGRGIKAREARELSIATLKSVGLADAERLMSSYSFELSGGMAQRAMIGMAIVGGARLVIADEPTSALDVSIQSQILRLLRDVREKTGSSLILITHDLGVAAENCDRVAVMYAGQIVEIARAETLFRQPAHPYTERLLKALPIPGHDALISIPGSVPDLISPPRGCRFANRCDRAIASCMQAAPALEEVDHGHRVACYRPTTPTSSTERGI